MKHTSYRLKTLTAMQAAMSQLKHYNSYLLYPVDEGFLEDKNVSEYLERYFECDFCDPFEKFVEREFCSAIVATIYHMDRLKDLSPADKQEAALKTCKGFIESLHLAKIEHHRYNNNMSSLEYAKRLRGINIINKAREVERIKKYKKKLGGRISLNAVLAFVGGPGAVMANTGARVLSGLLPESIKKPMRTISNKIKDGAIATIDANKEQIKSRPLVEKVVKVVHSAKKVYSKAKEAIKNSKIGRWYTKQKEKLRIYSY